MDTYHNTYTYETFKLLHNLAVLEEEELRINDIDLNIIKAHYNELKSYEINFDIYLSIVKKLSIEFCKIPVVISNIIYNQLKK